MNYTLFGVPNCQLLGYNYTPKLTSVLTVEKGRKAMCVGCNDSDPLPLHFPTTMLLLSFLGLQRSRVKARKWVTRCACPRVCTQ